jgi:hypothetical protein
MRETAFVSEALRSVARISESGEVCWSGDHIVDVLAELAAANRVILGFDILTFERASAPVDWGTSSYSITIDLTKESWDEPVKRSLKFALEDVSRTTDLSGLEPPFNTVWYCVSSVSPEEYRRL